ncbi:phage minor tail U family protein [Pasteurella multocida]|uniref:phage minor tail U family protein n=1 Tax=Pasteurella multocida TaxID=747 RepID=UPI001F52BB28|nr:phage minor tail U family protein [Pasteurella multocida]
MKIHTQIRQTLVAEISKKFKKVKEVINGKPSFVDIENNSPVVAVFISNVAPTDYLDGTNTGTLHIYLMMKSAAREDSLDKLAQEILDSNIVELSLRGLTESVVFSSFDYEQDDESGTWIGADIQYTITYTFEDL